MDGGYYQLTDSQFSVVAHVDATTGLLSRRYGYDSYGHLEPYTLIDIDGDGAGGTTTDDDYLWGAVDVASPSGDFNRDGVTDSSDWGDYLAAKDLTSPPADAPACGVFGWGDLPEPRIGYCGYVRAEWTTTVTSASNLKGSTSGGGANWWLARNRFFDPVAGRWINRDPSGYADGLSMYLYVRGNPWGLVDPTGLGGDSLADRIMSWFWDKGGHDDASPQEVQLEKLSKVKKDAQDFNTAAAPLVKGAIRVAGAAQMVGGIAESTGGWLSAETGVGLIPAVHGMDVAQSGYYTMMSGEFEPTVTSTLVSNGLQHMGVSENTAHNIGTGTDVALSVFGPAAAATSETRLFGVAPELSEFGRGASIRTPEAPATATPTGDTYSVAYETKLDPSVWGRSDSVHFNRANAVLDAAIQSDSGFASQMEELIPGVSKSVSRVGGRETPSGWIWNHATDAGVMQLTPEWQHTPGSIFWDTYHPGGLGGYALWARPAGAPKR